MNLGRWESVAQGEYHRGATYLKGPTRINHFVVIRPFSPNWFRSKGVRLEGPQVWNLVSSQYYLTVYHRFWLSVPPLNPHNRHTVTIFGGRCRQYPTDGMLLLGLHNSSHHTQPHSRIVQFMKYLWLNKVLNRRGKLWTCFRHVILRLGVENMIIHIDHVERTITLFTIYALLLSIRRIDFSSFAD